MDTEFAERLRLATSAVDRAHHALHFLSNDAAHYPSVAGEILDDARRQLALATVDVDALLGELPAASAQRSARAQETIARRERELRMAATN